MRKVIGSIVAAALAVTGFVVVAPNAAAVGSYSFSVNDVSQGETTGTASFQVCVSTHPATGDSVSVDATTADQTATAGADYTATGPTTFTFTNATADCQAFNVPILDDAVQEDPDETFQVNLSGNVTNTCSDGNPLSCPTSVSDSQGIGTILDPEDAGASGIGVSDDSTIEGNSGTTITVHILSFNPPVPAGETYSFDIITSDGPAPAATGAAGPERDYTPVIANDVAIAAGTSEFPFGVPVHGDTRVEPDENYTVTLSDPKCTPAPCTTPTITDPTGIGTILDDDGTVPPDPTAALNISDGVPFKASPKTECTFEVTRSGDTSGVVTVDYVAVSGTAKEGKHFVEANGTLTFAAGDTSETIVVDVIKKARRNKSFTVQLANASGASIEDGAGSCTIKRKKRR